MHEVLTSFAVLAYTAGGIVCHQLPERSFFWGAWQYPVCARCTGLYASAVLGLAGWAVARWRHRRAWRVAPRAALVVLAATALPTALSVVTAAAGWWDGGNVTRALLGVPLGATAGALLAAAVAKDLR